MYFCIKAPLPADFVNPSEDIQTRFHTLPFQYRPCSVLRVTALALLVIGITVAVLASNGQLAAFPGQVANWFQSLNWAYVGIGFAGFVVLSIGATVVIRRVLSLQNRITDHNIGKMTGGEHWVSASFKRDKDSFNCPGYIDSSTLDASGSGQAFFYIQKEVSNEYGVATMMFALTPLHVAAAMSYNVARAVLIPFYLLGCLATEACLGKALFEGQRRFEWRDIPGQVEASLERVVKAPFYGMALMYASLYVLVDPLNGRKLGTCIESDWNGGLTRAEGFWSVGGPQALWRPEGGGGPEKLGQNGFFAAGCWAPLAVVTYANGKVTQATSLSRAVNPTRGHQYILTTENMLRTEIEQKREPLASRRQRALDRKRDGIFQ
ncbi:MAG: hypothetical protein S4CHLAM2_02360 [Chlamydiales bacterium]|nr:hypothetical protein [Chlamydiales bacterium]